MIAVLTGTSAIIFSLLMAAVTGLVIISLLAAAGRRQQPRARRPPSEKIGLLSAPAVALGFVLLHYFTPNDDTPRLLRNSFVWLAILGFLLLLPTLFLPFAWVQWRRRQLSTDHRQEVSRRSSDVMLYQTIGNSLFIPLVLVAVVLVGAPWWAVLVAAFPVASGLLYLLRTRPNLGTRDPV